MNIKQQMRRSPSIKDCIEEWQNVKEDISSTLSMDTFWPLYFQNYDQAMQALEEAKEIILDKDALDRSSFGSYYESRKTWAREWLKKWGFEEG